MKFTTYYFVLRNNDFEPFLLCKDGAGVSTLDCNGYQVFYDYYSLKSFLNNPAITVIGKWEEA